VKKVWILRLLANGSIAILPTEYGKSKIAQAGIEYSL
jgi:hypothetical protein